MLILTYVSYVLIFNYVKFLFWLSVNLKGNGFTLFLMQDMAIIMLHTDWITRYIISLDLYSQTFLKEQYKQRWNIWPLRQVDAKWILKVKQEFSAILKTWLWRHPLFSSYIILPNVQINAYCPKSSEWITVLDGK